MEYEYGRDLCVRGYHVYEAIWRAVVGETLACEREPRNVHDRYAVAVKKSRKHHRPSTKNYFSSLIIVSKVMPRADAAAPW